MLGKALLGGVEGGGGRGLPGVAGDLEDLELLDAA